MRNSRVYDRLADVNVLVAARCLACGPDYIGAQSQSLPVNRRQAGVRLDRVVSVPVAAKSQLQAGVGASGGNVQSGRVAHRHVGQLADRSVELLGAAQR